MAFAVFLRGVNVGGRSTLKPSEIARTLADLEVTNIGAAGTFVVARAKSEKSLRAAILGNLPFKPEVFVSSGAQIQALVDSEPFAEAPSDDECTRYFTIMASAPSPRPKLPIERPTRKPWEVRVFRIEGPIALSLSRVTGKARLYPNEVVEKELGVAATTRNWNTILSLSRTLKGN